jgi:hypothetical protein
MICSKVKKASSYTSHSSNTFAVTSVLEKGVDNTQFYNSIIPQIKFLENAILVTAILWLAGLNQEHLQLHHVFTIGVLFVWLGSLLIRKAQSK